MLLTLSISPTVSAGQSRELPGGSDVSRHAGVPEPVIKKCTPEVRARLDSLIVRHDRCYRGEVRQDSLLAYANEAYSLSRDECGIDSPECIDAFIRLIRDVPEYMLDDFLKALTFQFNPWGPYVGYAYYELGKVAEQAGKYELAANAFGGAMNSDLPDRMKILSRFKHNLFQDREEGLMLRIDWNDILKEIRKQPKPEARSIWFEINLQLARFYYDNGNFDEALKRIKIAEDYFGYASTINECSLLRVKYKSLLPTDPHAAMLCLDREIELLSHKRRLDYDERLVLAEALMLRGDFEISEHMNYRAGLDYYERSLEAIKTPFVRLTEPYAQTVCRLMDIRRQLNMEDQVIPEAEDFVARCKALQERDKFNRGALLLAECYLISGRATDARNLIDSVAADINESDANFSRFMLVKSRLDMFQGGFDDAERQLEWMLNASTSYQGRLDAVRNLAVLYLAYHDPRFSEIVESLYSMTKENVMSHIMQISPKQRRNWLMLCRRTINNLAMFSNYSDISLNRLADLNLYMKGLLFRTSSEINGILDRHPDTHARLAELRKKKILLNNAVAVGDTVRSAGLASEIDDEERKLVGSLASIPELSAAVDRSVDDVLKKISDTSLVVDFVKDSGKPEIVYGALVYSRRMSPVYVSLFADNGKITSDIGKTIWEKIGPYAEGYTDIYFSAEGILNRLPIEFAPYGADSLPICFQKRMHRVFHLADIGNDCNIGERILAVGVSDHNSPVAQSEPVFKGNWVDLREVDAEMDAIVNRFGKQRVTLLHNDSATEDRFKSVDGKGINVLHISTHGVFRDHDALIKAYNDTNDFDHNMARRVIGGGLDNLSGLVLRRGNLTWKSADIDTEEDDILTAEEIETLSFPDLRLTVLSACDTGLGDIDPEGVWGLQRAFRVAGTKFMICALDKVDQYWSAMFMDLFYENASRGKSIYESFGSTVRELYDMNPGQPEIWSSFILIE